MSLTSAGSAPLTMPDTAKMVLGIGVVNRGTTTGPLAPNGALWNVAERRGNTHPGEGVVDLGAAGG